jgi:error-prone DNA polymerase
MRARGYAPEFARQIVRQIQGFGEYGFPESHAASFALLVYVSAWLKCHAPAAFTAALLDSQPMGFYAPAQLVQCARRHGVEVRAVDAVASHVECRLEPRSGGGHALRLGLGQVAGLSAAGAARLVAARESAPFRDVADLAGRALLDRGDLGALAAANALARLVGHRHRARWAVAGVEAPLPLLVDSAAAEGLPLLRAPTTGEDVVADYATLGLSLGPHPLSLLRRSLLRRDVRTAEALWDCADGGWVHVAGIVTTRQRPGSAAGVVFVTLEDETGCVNLVLWQQVAARFRTPLLAARLLAAWGRVQRQGDVLHVVAGRLADYSALLGRLVTRSRDFS